MYEQTRSILNDEYRSVSSGLFERAKKYNAMWGPEYAIFTAKGMNDDEIEEEIDRIIFLSVFVE